MRIEQQYNEEKKVSEEVVKVFRVENGQAMCHDGYLPHFLLPSKELYTLQQALVVEVFKDHENKSCRAHWHHNGGVALCEANIN